jgi:hypothetical protein
MMKRMPEGDWVELQRMTEGHWVEQMMKKMPEEDWVEQMMTEGQWVEQRRRTIGVRLCEHHHYLVHLSLILQCMSTNAREVCEQELLCYTSDIPLSSHTGFVVPEVGWPMISG